MKSWSILLAAVLLSAATLTCGREPSSRVVPRGLSTERRFIDKTGALIAAPYPSWWSEFVKGVEREEANRGGGVNPNKRVVIGPEIHPVRLLGGDPVEIVNFSRLANLYTSTRISPESTPIPVSVRNEYGYFERDGTLCFRLRCMRPSSFSEGMAAVSVGALRDEKWGYIDKTGAWAIEPQYYRAGGFSEGLAAVWTGVKLGNIEETRTLLSRTTSIEVLEGGVWGYVNQEGKFAIDPQFSDAGAFVNGLAPAHVSDEDGFTQKVGFINKGGEFVLESKDWTRTKEFGEGLAPVQIVQQEGLRSIGPLRPGSQEPIVEGMPKWIRWGYVDAEGTTRIEPQFAEAKPFSDGLAAVRVGEKWGYIDKSGELVIEPQFKLAWSFSNGVAVVTLF